MIQNFHKIINPFYQQYELKLKQNQHLSSLRDWLLPMLMNGQVTVGAAQEMLGMVAEDKGYYKTK